MIQRLVRIGALPERVEEHRIEARERVGEVRRVRHQWATLQDQLQVVPRALGILEPGRPQRRQARQARSAARRELADREELPEGPVHRRRDRPVARLELPRRARRRRLDADAPGDAPELQPVLGKQPVLDGSQVLVVP